MLNQAIVANPDLLGALKRGTLGIEAGKPGIRRSGFEFRMLRLAVVDFHIVLPGRFNGRGESQAYLLHGYHDAWTCVFLIWGTPTLGRFYQLLL